MDSGTSKRTQSRTSDRYKSPQSPTIDTSTPVPTGTQIVQRPASLLKRVKRAVHRVKRWPRKLFRTGKHAQPNYPQENANSVTPPIGESSTRPRRPSPSSPRAAKRQCIGNLVGFSDSFDSDSETVQSLPKPSIEHSPSKASSKSVSKTIQDSAETPSVAPSAEESTSQRRSSSPSPQSEAMRSNIMDAERDLAELDYNAWREITPPPSPQPTPEDTPSREAAQRSLPQPAHGNYNSDMHPGFEWHAEGLGNCDCCGRECYLYLNHCIACDARLCCRCARRSHDRHGRHQDGRGVIPTA